MIGDTVTITLDVEMTTQITLPHEFS